MTDVQITVKGLDRLIKGLGRFPREIAGYMAKAGREASEDNILKTKGLFPYPSETAANMPPTPYYIRGRGTQTARGNKANSERLGTQFYTKASSLNTNICNRASYAKWVIGEQQASAMKRIGWKKLFDVAKEKKAKIQKVYQAWVDKALRDFGL